MEFTCQVYQADRRSREGCAGRSKHGRGSAPAAGAGAVCRSIFARGVGRSRFGRGNGSKHIKPDDFILFNQQFVALIRAGLPILKSLDLLKDRIANPLLRQAYPRRA